MMNFKEEVFDPDAPPRTPRPLRTEAPVTYSPQTSDGVELRLTRYQGGAKGPVILSHCIGVSSLMYSIDTIETNLLEFLYEAGFDVWLLDHRLSIDLPASRQQSTLDDVATKDYPAAVAEVLKLTGATSTQLVCHGVGSSTFTMAMLAGLEGVRSAVLSQVSTDLFMPFSNRVKTRFRIPTILRAIGVPSITAYTDKRASLMSRLYNFSVMLYPKQVEEWCCNPVCHRITSIYGTLYEHDQLNAATHLALHELFGLVNLTAMRHLSLIALETHLVNRSGKDVYLPNLERLAIPIAFIHGSENICVLPSSTEKTMERLANGSDRYKRHLIKGYGHVDCMFGKNASRDVFPHVLAHLDDTS